LIDVSTPHSLSHMLSKSTTFLYGVLKQVQHDGVEMSFHHQSSPNLNTKHDKGQFNLRRGFSKKHIRHML
jgi:hypothetical protein